MAGAHGSTADFVRPKTPETIKNSINVYDALHADPKPDIEAMVAKELAKEMPKIKDTCKCAPHAAHSILRRTHLSVWCHCISFRRCTDLLRRFLSTVTRQDVSQALHRLACKEC